MTRLRAFLATLMLTVLAGVLGACAAIPPANLKSPELQFQDFEVRSLGLQNIEFSLTLRADNPNAVMIPLNNLNFDLDLLGKSFAAGKTREPTVSLPANASRDVTIDFSIPTSRLISTLSELRTARLEDIGYALRGQAQWGDGGFSLPFERAGSLNLLKQFEQLLNPLIRER